MTRLENDALLWAAAVAIAMLAVEPACKAAKKIIRIFRDLT